MQHPIDTTQCFVSGCDAVVNAIIYKVSKRHRVSCHTFCRRHLETTLPHPINKQLLNPANNWHPIDLDFVFVGAMSKRVIACFQGIELNFRFNIQCSSSIIEDLIALVRIKTAEAVRFDIIAAMDKSEATAHAIEIGISNDGFYADLIMLVQNRRSEHRLKIGHAVFAAFMMGIPILVSTDAINARQLCTTL